MASYKAGKCFGSKRSLYSALKERFRASRCFNRCLFALFGAAFSLIRASSTPLLAAEAVLAACSYAYEWQSALVHLAAAQRLAPESDDLTLQFGIVAKACAYASAPSKALLEQPVAPPEWLSVLHWQQALEHFQKQPQNSASALGSPLSTHPS